MVFFFFPPKDEAQRFFHVVVLPHGNFVGTCCENQPPTTTVQKIKYKSERRTAAYQRNTNFPPVTLFSTNQSFRFDWSNVKPVYRKKLKSGLKKKGRFLPKTGKINDKSHFGNHPSLITLASSPLPSTRKVQTRKCEHRAKHDVS